MDNVANQRSDYGDLLAQFFSKFAHWEATRAKPIWGLYQVMSLISTFLPEEETRRGGCYLPDVIRRPALRK